MWGRVAAAVHGGSAGERQELLRFSAPLSLALALSDAGDGDADARSAGRAGGRAGGATPSLRGSRRRASRTASAHCIIRACCAAWAREISGPRRGAAPRGTPPLSSPWRATGRWPRWPSPAASGTRSRWRRWRRRWWWTWPAGTARGGTATSPPAVRARARAQQEGGGSAAEGSGEKKKRGRWLPTSCPPLTPSPPRPAGARAPQTWRTSPPRRATTRSSRSSRVCCAARCCRQFFFFQNFTDSSVAPRAANDAPLAASEAPPAPRNTAGEGQRVRRPAHLRRPGRPQAGRRGAGASAFLSRAPAPTRHFAILNARWIPASSSCPFFRASPRRASPRRRTPSGATSFSRTPANSTGEPAPPHGSSRTHPRAGPSPSRFSPRPRSQLTPPPQNTHTQPLPVPHPRPRAAYTTRFL